ncbi:MAG TPA: CHAT domain-containing protein [bacterium]|nr:CHAT domain-containing protein [bacterium]
MTEPGLKNSRIRFVFCFFWLIGTAAGTNISEPAEREPIQVTTHPDPDYGPAVSPDGRWLAFVSERSGNPDIWIKPLPTGTAVQITTHQAEDTEPCWHPDGKHLIFVSKRRDARGDLWKIPVNLKRGGRVTGKPEPLTQYLGMDGYPTVSPDGRKVAFVSDRNGKKNIWLLDWETGKMDPLTLSGGHHPAWSIQGKLAFTSYQRNPKGEIALMFLSGVIPDSESRIRFLTHGPWIDREPAWSPDGNTLVFVRFDEDTDGDGRITPMDQASLRFLPFYEDAIGWETEHERDRSLRLTAGEQSSFQPHWGADGRLYCTSTRGGGLDIWSSLPEGRFPRVSTAAGQFEMAMEWSVQAFTRQALNESILGYQRILDFFPREKEWKARALLQMADLYTVLNRPDKRQECLDQIILNDPGDRLLLARARLKQASGPDSLSRRIELCRSVIEEFQDERSVQVEAWILLGDLYSEQGRRGQALSAYSEAVQLGEGLPNLKAPARLKIGDVLKEEQEETARLVYLSVLREYGDVPLWRERAGERLLSQVREAADPIPGYRAVIQELPEFPLLQARAQLSIAGVLAERRQWDSALRELQVLEETSFEDWAQAESRIARARIHRERTEELEASLILEEVMNRYATVEGGVYYAQARELLFQILSESARRLAGLGDLGLAEARYRRALAMDSDDLELHRGLIETAYRAGRLETLSAEYEAALEEDKRNPALLYARGLILSFLGETDRRILKKSNEWLYLALAEDYRMIHPYRTLGYNYELIERLEERDALKKDGFVRGFLNLLTAPLRWAWGLLPGGDSPTKGYYEKAIAALITALELNDETLDPFMEARLAQNLANNFFNLGEYGYQKAFDYYLLRLKMDSTFSHPLEEATFYERAGRCGLVVTEYATVTRFLDRAIDIYASLDRKDKVYQNKQRLAFIHHLAGEFEAAIEIYRETVVEDERHGRREAAQLGYRNLAYNCHMMGDPRETIRYAEKSLALIKTPVDVKRSSASSLRIELFGFSIPVWRMADIGGASSEGFTQADEAALVYNLLSISHESEKQFHQALEYELKRLAIFRARKDAMARRISLNRLGTLYYRMGDFHQAWYYYHWSLLESRKQKDQRGHLINALNLAHVAAAFMTSHSMEYFEEAERILQRALVQAKRENPQVCLSLMHQLGVLRAMAARERYSEGGAHDQVLVSFERLRDYEKAMQWFETGRALSDSLNLDDQRALFFANLGGVHSALGDYGSALGYYHQARVILERRGEEELLWRVYYGLARLQEAKGDSAEKALGLYEKAINLLEALPVQEEGSEERLADRVERVQIYADAAGEMVRQGRIHEALIAIEQGHQKFIADILARRPPELSKERHKIAWGNVRYLRTMLRKTRFSLSQAVSGTAAAETLKSQLAVHEVEYRTLRDQLKREDEVLAYMAGALPVDLRRIQERIPRNGTAIRFVSLRAATLVFAVETDTIRCLELPISRDRLMFMTKELFQGLKADSGLKVLQRTWEKELIQPVQALLKRKDWVLIVPDGPLWPVPIHALSYERPPLLEQHTVVWSPSLMAFVMAHERRRINQTDMLMAGGSTELARQISRNTAAINLKTIQGKRLDRDILAESLGKADLVHLYGELVVNQWEPLAGGFGFTGFDKDVMMTAEDLFPLPMKASLFFLPPFRFGGQLEEAFLPVYYGLLYSGVPAVVLVDWDVSIDAGGRMAGLFYQNLIRLSAAEALASAQKEVRRTSKSIKDWAGYRLMGYAGMNAEERVRFASDNLNKTLQIGFGYEQRRDYEDAIRYYEQAQVMAGAMNDSFTAGRIRQLIIRASYRGGLWEKAVTVQKEILTESERLSRSDKVLESLENLVVFFINSRRYDEAARIKTRVIRHLRDSGNSGEALNKQEELAFLYALNRRYDRADQIMDSLMIAHRSLDDSLSLAKARVRRGRFALEGDRAEEAYVHLEQAVTFLHKSAEDDSTARMELAAALQLLGSAAEQLTLYDEALKRQQASLNLFQALNRPDQAAQALQHLANIHWKSGRYRQAMEYQTRAMEQFEARQNRRMLAAAFSTQGLIYLSLGDRRRAREAQARALNMAESIGSLEDQATILKNMGLVAIQERVFDLALESFRRAADIDSELGYQRGLAYDWRNLGMLYLETGETESAVSLLREGRMLSRRVGDRRNEIQCQFGLSRAYQAQRKTALALALADSALHQALSLGIPDIAWRIHRLRAGIRDGQGRHELALDDLSRAIDLVEAMRAELKVEAFQQGFLDDKMDLYSDMIRLLIRLNRHGEALTFVERAKSRSFIDLLANQALALSRAQGAWLEEESRIRQSIEEARTRVSLLLSGTGSEDELSVWHTVLEQRRREYEAFMVRLQAENPELSSFVQVDPWSVEQIQSVLPDSAAMLIYYLDEGLYTWCLTRDDLKFQKTLVPDSVLERQTRRFRESIQAHLSVDREARTLYDRLIRPVDSFLKDINHLVVIPHGVLHYLPFAAIKGDEYLIQRFSLSSAPSATVFGYCREKERTRIAAGSVAAFSNPALGPEYNLPFADKEVQAIVRTYEQVEAYHGSEVTESKIREAVRNREIIHFACHAEYEPANPLFSALLLTPEGQDDGRLEAHEIFGLDLDCGLVMLSACETGLAHITRGDDVIGLARGFIFAGTPSIVTSLWKVDDLATAVLVKRFYRYLRAGESRARALQKAQRLVMDQVNQHPSAWAAFQLTGDFR